MREKDELSPILTFSGKYEIIRVNRKTSGALRRCKVGDILKIEIRINNVYGCTTKSGRDDATYWVINRIPKNPKEESEEYQVSQRVMFGAFTGTPPIFDLEKIEDDERIKEFCKHLCLMRDDGVTCKDCPLYKNRK